MEHNLLFCCNCALTFENDALLAELDMIIR